MTSGYGLGELLPLAMAIAINPIPVIACILILFTARARVTGPLFLVGWVAGITVLTTAAFILSEATDATDAPAIGPSVGDVVLVALGIGLIALATRQWRSRPAPDEDTVLPAWTATLDDLSPLRALGFGLLLATPNPKHLGLAVAAALTVANVVRLAAYARRDEIEIMQLVGAPFAFIRGPFVAEGILQGGLGAVVAIVLLWAIFLTGKAWYGDLAVEGLGLTTLTFLPFGVLLTLVGGGMLLGCVGGLIVARTVR